MCGRTAGQRTSDLLVVLAAAIALGACAAETTGVRDGVPTPALDIRDGRSGGSYRFYFQPPIAPTTNYSGTFDPAARPMVRIAQWNPPGALVAEFTDTSGISMELAAEQYVARWRTSTCNLPGCRLEPGRTYRVTVMDPRRFVVFGWADVRPVRQASDLPTVPPGEVGVVFGQVLPIRFRIETPRVAFVRVSPVQSVLDVGRVQQLAAVATDSGGQVVPNVTFAWSSSRAFAVAVSSNGVATGVAPGSAVIQASVDGVNGYALATAESRPGLRILPGRAVIAIGQALQLAAADSLFLPVPGAQWFALDPQVLVVSPGGVATGVSPGVGRVRVLTNTGMYEALITVQGTAPRLNVMPPRDSMVVGQQHALVATDGSGTPIPWPGVSWASSNPIVAVVSQQGIVTAVSPGTASVFAMRGALAGQGTVVVVGAPVPEVAPVLQQPTDSVRVRQDDPTVGCPPGPAGYGFAFPFSWTAGFGPKSRIGDHFDLRDTMGASVIDAITGAVAGLWWGACGVEVADDRLDGWNWRVQTQYADGTFGPWSQAATFGFLPRYTSPNLVTFPHDYGAGRSQVSLSGATDAITSATVRLGVRYATPSGIGFLPASAVEFHHFDGRFYRRIGAASGCVISDNGFQRFFQCSLDWDPAAPTAPGTYPVVATVRDVMSGARFVGAFLDVTVVP